MNKPFEKIRITDLDLDLTQPSQEASGFCRLYLTLSGEPPPEWVKLFEQKRRFPRQRVWRNAWVLDAHIVVECIPKELEQFELNHLKEDVANANKMFSEWVVESDAQNLRKFQEQAATRKQLEELRGKLNFD